MNTSGDIQTKRLKHLIQASQSLAYTESVEQLLPKLLDLAQEVTGAQASSILLYNPDIQALEFTLANNMVLGAAAGEKLMRDVTIPLGQGVAGWVAANRAPALVTDAANDKRFTGQVDAQTGFTTSSLICVPIQAPDELIGVIEVLNPVDRKYFDEQDQEILESFAGLAAVAMVRSRLFEAKLASARLNTELEAAARIQNQFWPSLPEPGHGFNIWAHSEPARFVGGDLYDCIRLHDDSWVFYVADVAGKGLPASLVMAAVWSKIRSDAPFRVDTAELLSGVNNDMYDFLVRNEVFVTIVLGRFLPEAGFLQLSKAGHLWPIWRGAEGLKQVPRLTGVPLGVIPDTGYSVAEIHLDPGDDMLFLTDGVTEAVNPQGEMFGEARVERLVAEAGALPCGPVVAEAVSAWRGGGHPGDDTTLLELWREP